MDRPPQPPVPPPNQAERVREARVRRRRAMRQYLIVGLCFVALLCLGAVAVGYLYYDRATKPDLSTPEHVTRKYLEAYLIDRDDYAAKQYQCSDDSGLAEVRALRSDIDSRQKAHDISINVSLDSVRETSRSGNQAQVSVDLVLSTVDAGNQLNRVQHWAIVARNDAGWHVCAAHQPGS